MANVSYIAGAGFVTVASAARRLWRHEHEHRPPFGGIQSHPTSPSRSSATAIGTGMLTATLQKGSDELWCSVPGHKNKGMDLTIKVG